MMTKEQQNKILEDHEARMALREKLQALISEYTENLGINGIIGELEVVKCQAAGFLACRAFEDSKKKGEQP